MSITLTDSATGMRDMLEAGPRQWPGAARRLWDPVGGMYSFIPGGPDLAAVHRQSFGFGPDAPPERVSQALQTLEEADAWGRMERALRTGAETLAQDNPGIRVPDIKVLLLLGDPGNTHFMDELRGLSAFGGISGYIAITVWPHPEVLHRLEAIALHELHHNVRYSPGGVLWDPRTVTVGEQVVAEGLAVLFAAQMQGERGYTHFVSEHTRRSDDVLRRVVGGLGVTGMQDFVAWILGDASARLFGATPVGLPTGAGYAAGARIVRAYLEATGRTASACAATDSEAILEVALPRLGLAADTK